MKEILAEVQDALMMGFLGEEIQHVFIFEIVEYQHIALGQTEPSLQFLHVRQLGGENGALASCDQIRGAGCLP